MWNISNHVPQIQLQEGQLLCFVNRLLLYKQQMPPCSLCIPRTALRLHLVDPWGVSVRQWTRTISTTPSFRSSTPLQDSNVPKHTAAASSLPVSTAPAGTVLKGLNYFKNKQDPVAREEHEYPAWLWTVQDEMKWRSTENEDVGDLYCMTPSKREELFL